MTYASKTPEQQKNFHTLLNGMIEMYGDKRFDDHFDMASYQNGRRTTSDFCGHFTEHDCDTSACLLGHGPIFGIGHLGASWIKYSRDFFGLGPSMMAWQFLFNEDWPSDIQESIARLSVYIDGFDPEDEYWDCASSYVGDSNV